MQGLVAISILIVMAHQLRVASAQLLTCTDIGCPLSESVSRCTIEDQWLTALGVSNFTTDLSTEQLSWTVGYVPRGPFEGNDIAPDTRNFYWGQPPSLDLRGNTSIAACALFFDGIASKLKFNVPDPIQGRGSCADALTTSCVTEWIEQAQGEARQLDGTHFTCQNLADKLRSNPPSSCKVAKKSWGSVTAHEISGSQMPVALTNQSCNPTINSTYSVTKVHSVNSSELSYHYITPVFTVIKSATDNSNTDINTTLSCLKPIFDGASSDQGLQGGSVRIYSHLALQMLIPCVLAFQLFF